MERLIKRMKAGLKQSGGKMVEILFDRRFDSVATSFPYFVENSIKIAKLVI